MKAMELKVWVDGVQRIVCGVTEFTTCQEVVIALAQAIGRTGRYALIEKWRETERHLSPQENPVVSLNKWGQYASDVQLILRRTGPSVSERPDSDGLARGSERAFYRQSLPPLAKLRPSVADRSLKRREPKRKSLTFGGGLREIFGRSRDQEAKQRQQRGVTLNLTRLVAAGVSVPSSPARELSRLVQLQRDKLQLLDGRLLDCEVRLRDWEEASEDGNLQEELLLLEQQVMRNDAEMEEEEFWQNELSIEQENERRLRQQLAELQGRIRDCEDELSQYLAHMQSMEEERLQQEEQLSHMINEEELQAQLEKVTSELEVQNQHTIHLENGCQVLERSLGQSSKKLQEKEQQLEQLTKELRQVNLQQFIQQTGTKVTVLPAQPAGDSNNNNNNIETDCGSLRRLLQRDLRHLQSSNTCSLNPEGIYV
ncbi:ras association domain-containing protein 8b [Nerophis lumbriciformis]|uniref:ras association domain-containing protein 8b n=1 Tax=Nerophis lumbriciformis TaxID=546530 RepID=UPI002AE06A19|nr:ras association domain-containing protein 8-like [Nerophis lumbriciformis]